MPNKTRSTVQLRRSLSSSVTHPQLRQLSSPTNDAPLTSQSRQQLLTTHHLLQLTFHRNKNQHRRAKWWKWLSMLYRSVGKLLGLTEGLEAGVRRRPVPGASVVDVQRARRMTPVSRQSTASDGEGSKWDDRAVYLRQRIVPGCYRAFNDVVADNQFASLGLVLLGLLARVYKIVGGGGSTASRGALCHEDEQRLLSADRAFELERGEQTEQIPGTLGLNAGHAQRLDTTKAAREQSPDFGEVVSRESLVSSMDTTC